MIFRNNKVMYIWLGIFFLLIIGIIFFIINTNGPISLSPSVNVLEVYSIVQTSTGTEGFVLSGTRKIAFTTENGDFADIPVTCETSSSGDVNGDGVVNMIDVQKVINSVYRIETFNVCFDINKDGLLNQEDVDKLINALN